MGILNIRNLPDDIHARLRVRAAQHGRSMEAEAREIIAAAFRDPSEAPVSGDELQAFVARLYGDEKPEGVVDDLIRARRREAAAE